MDSKEGFAQLPRKVTGNKLQIRIVIETDNWSDSHIASETRLTTLETLLLDGAEMLDHLSGTVLLAAQRYLDALTDHNRRASAGEYDDGGTE
jgi:hypothetical protein